MKLEELLKYTRGKTKIITFKINPDLLARLDKAIEADKNIQSRSHFLEKSIVDYLIRKSKNKKSA